KVQPLLLLAVFHAYIILLVLMPVHVCFSLTFYRYIRCIFVDGRATTEFYSLSLHDALPISEGVRAGARRPLGRGHRARHAAPRGDRKSTRLNSSHVKISYAVFCLKKKK